MNHRLSMSIAILTFVALPLAAQAPKAPLPPKTAPKAAPSKAWTPPRTPWGDPDLQGVWNDATSTPLQRPSGVASHAPGDCWSVNVDMRAV